MTSRRARETSSDAVENDTIENIVLKNSYIILGTVSLATLEVIWTQKWEKLAKFRNLTLKHALFDLEDYKPRSRDVPALL